MGLFDIFKDGRADAIERINNEKNDTRNWTEKASNKELNDIINDRSKSISRRAMASEELINRKKQQ